MHRFDRVWFVIAPRWVATVLTVSAAFAEEETPVSFRNDILPILNRAGCSSGSCHAKADGQNGFALSVFSYDPWSDYREIVHNARGRRIFPAAPEHSLLLLKATNEISHEGEKRIEVDSEFYETIRRWIGQGAPWEIPEEPSLEGITVSPEEATYEKGESRAIKVTATYSNGETRDVTGLTEFQSNEEAFASVDHHGVIRAGSVPGEGVIIARYVDKVAGTRVVIPSDVTLPASAYAALPVNNEIDRLAYRRFEKLGLLPSETCSDSEFIRRATLDTLGRLPTPEVVKAFLADSSEDKRSRYIDELLSESNRSAYADFWATKWGDLLRPNTQRVGTKPVYLLDHWIRDQFRRNRPWDDMVRELLTASGSSHQYGPVAVFRDKREPADMTEFVSQLFLGVRLNCARCHHHPSEKWGQDDYFAMAAFFGSMKRKGQGISPPISGESEFWWFQPGGTVKHPVTEATMIPKAPAGPEFPGIEKDQDPREVFAEWLTDPENPFFARAMVNRVWGELFGRGIVHPVDDFRDSNPPVNEAMIDWLADDFASHGFDQKHLLRTLLNSRLYQQSSEPNETNVGDLKNFSRSYRRRLPAEVLLDSLSGILRLPEKFQGLVQGSPAMQQWNHKMPNEFLDAFGRPDSSAAPPCEREMTGSVVQALHLMNARGLQKKLSGSPWLKELSGKKVPDAVEELYLALFSRLPDEKERAVTADYIGREEAKAEEAIEDLFWSLVNSPEFVLNH